MLHQRDSLSDPSQALVSSMFTEGGPGDEPEFDEAVGSAACDEGAARGPGDAGGLAEKGDDALAQEGIPDLDGAILATGGDECTIRGPGEARDVPAVTLIEEEQFPSTGIPDVHGRIKTRGGDVAVVGRPLHVTDDVVMVLIGDEVLPGCCNPDLDHSGIAGIGGIIGEQAFSRVDIPHVRDAIAFAYGDAGTIGRPGDAIDGADRVVVVREEEEFPATGIPDLGGGIEADRGDTGAVGRPSDAGDCPALPTIDEEKSSGLSPPYLNGGILTTSCQKFAIGRPSNAAYRTHMPAIGCEGIPVVHDRVRRGK